MEADGDGVQVCVESSWNVLQGSLDKCVTVVFLDPQTHDPIISTSPRGSENLVLVPPAESVPCEITVKFQGRLCHVQSFYTSSTARICELYSQSKLKTDRDYICTVKGWIPYENSLSDEGTEMVSEAAGVTHRNGMQVTDFIEKNRGASVMSSVGSSTVALNPAVDVDLEKSLYSSSDESWVDVKLNGSFTGENACVSFTAPECDNWQVPLNEHELVHLEDQSVLGRPGSKPKEAVVEADSNLDGCCEGKMQFKEHIVQGNAHQQDMFEAELELVDHNPWAAITIRLLSLQDKSLVVVDQMVFLAVSGLVPEPASPCQSADQGANSLFAMFLPSMLQMARGVSDNSRSQLKFENSSKSCEQAQDMEDELPAENLNQSCDLAQDMMDKLPAGREQVGIASLQKSVEEEVSVQEGSRRDLAAHLLNLGGDQEISWQSDFNGAESKRTVEIGEQPFQSNSNAMPRCNCKTLAGDLMAKDLASTLEAFSERFDRLESLCLRMESYLQRTFENLDQRIMHLEVQHRKGSEETDCVSLKQSGLSADVSVMQSRHNNQESPPSSMQYTALSDLPPRSECKEGVSISLTQSAEQGYSEAQDVLKEVPNPILFDVVNSDFGVAENLVKEAPSESGELSRGSVGNKKPCAFLDEAWASALSAFASSFTPVDEAENTVTDVVDQQPSGSSCGMSISMPQECETLRKEGNSSKATSQCDVDFVAEFTNHANSEALNSEDGPIREAPCNEQTGTAHALWIGISLEKPDNLLSSQFPNTSTSVPNDSFDLLGLKEMPNMSSKDRTGVNHLLEDRDLAKGFSSLSQDALSACPLFDVFASGQSNSMLLREPKDSSPALRGFQTGLSPVFDSTSSEMQDADFLSVGNEATEFHPCHVSTLSNNFSQCQEKRDFFHFEEKNQEYLFNFDDEASTSNAEGVRYIKLCTSNALQTEENKEEIFCNIRVSSTIDFLGDSISREKGKTPDMNEVQDPESFDSTSFMYCETEEATSFPDVLEEDCSNYQDGRACSEDSLCFSQDFDTCQNELCEDEWSCAPNIFYMNDPELTDDETIIAVADVHEKIEMSDISDTDSTEDLPFWPVLHDERIDQEPTTTVFPGFENLSGFENRS